jgi:DNA-binding protein HU-beta
MSNTTTTAAPSISKDQIADALQANHPDIKTKKSALEAVETVFKAIGDGLAKGGEVRLHGFGHFKTTPRPARTGRNPRTGEDIQIPASTAVKFSPAKALKESASA